MGYETAERLLGTIEAFQAERFRPGGPSAGTHFLLMCLTDRRVAVVRTSSFKTLSAILWYGLFIGYWLARRRARRIAKKLTLPLDRFWGSGSWPQSRGMAQWSLAMARPLSVPAASHHLDQRCGCRQEGRLSSYQLHLDVWRPRQDSNLQPSA